MFLHESWPWCKGQSSVLTVAVDGTAKVGSHVGVITTHIFRTAGRGGEEFFFWGGGGGILFFWGGIGGSGGTLGIFWVILFSHFSNVLMCLKFLTSHSETQLNC